jgi:nucleoside-diphosphate kinase
VSSMASTTSMTLAIIKPDAVRAGNTGSIIQRINDQGFKLRGMKMLQMTRPVAEGFYEVHRERGFFNDLVEFMTSGPSVVIALENENAVQAWRDLMGPTDATKAPRGTIRGDFGTSVQENATHGSDSPENAKVELDYFFKKDELC